MTADPLLRAWLEGQEGVSDEMRAALAGALGLGGPVIEGTATEVSAPARDPGPPDPGVDLGAWAAEAERAERIVAALTDKLDMLACALGACPSCWGTAGTCEACGGGGRGGPGSFLPDPDCFDRFVTPVLRLMAGRRAQPSHNHGD